MSNTLTRRRFLQAGATAGAGLCILGHPIRGLDRSLNAKLNVAVIGAGGRGTALVRALAQEHIVALCDVDEKRAARSFEEHPKANRYHDYRVLLDTEKTLDAVVIATPDHMHAPIALNAMRRGLHCYCEKPLTWSIEEARLMAETAAEMKVATQMGNHGSAKDGFRRGVEMLRAGVLGDVSEVHVWTNRPWWPQGCGRPEGSHAVPTHLKWDLWLGAAQKRPYIDDAYHPFKWRGWYDFGTGALGDMACHTMNLAWRGLELRDPATVSCWTTERQAETYPAGGKVLLSFPERGKLPPLDLYWYEGSMRPDATPLPKDLAAKMPGAGLAIFGSKGAMFSPDDYGSKQLYHPHDLSEFEAPRTLPRAKKGHMEEWVAACKGGPKAFSDFSVAGPFVEWVLLGNLAMRTGKEIVWDAKALKAKGVPEADPFIRRAYRQGFGIR